MRASASAAAVTLMPMMPSPGRSTFVALTGKTEISQISSAIARRRLTAGSRLFETSRYSSRNFSGKFGGTSSIDLPINSSAGRRFSLANASLMWMFRRSAS